MHFDCRDLSVKRHPDVEFHPYDTDVCTDVYKRGEKVDRILHLMKQMIKPSRLNSRYCATYMSSFSGESRPAINLNAFVRHGTIEIRLHHGTVSYNDIAGWAEFIYHIMRFSEVKNRVRTWDEFKYEYKNLPPRVLKYVQERLMKYNVPKKVAV